ncbi:MAG: sulfide/dihydroorotate dehydrogenase-like FAD/NAD-binding protein [Candidatus Margulisiibacteriota bacterium]|jgi:ferredoxin--NADP+ reductase
MKVIKNEYIADTQNIRLGKIVISAPEIARKAQPGQFVVVMVKEEGERIPLTVVDASDGKITLIYQEAGFSTRLLGTVKTGADLYAVAGPLGHATEMKNYGKVVVVGGGVGIAEIYPVAKKLKLSGNTVEVIVGARNKDLLFLTEELKPCVDVLHICTDDGTAGRKGFTTDILKELLDKGDVNLVYAVGPLPMMQRAGDVTKPYNVKTLVSLNTLMLDATGMCGVCRVTIDGKVKFACVDGPEFDAHLVDWSELGKRNRMYIDKEKHICNIMKATVSA